MNFKNTTCILTRCKICDSRTQEFVIDGETVVALVSRRRFVDVYQTDFMLITPAAGLPPRGPRFTAAVSNHLIYAGTVAGHEDDWTVSSAAKTAKVYEYQNEPVGSFVF